jgi:hypothetical protein
MRLTKGRTSNHGWEGHVPHLIVRVERLIKEQRKVNIHEPTFNKSFVMFGHFRRSPLSFVMLF